MKPTLLTGVLLLAAGAVAHAQFSLLPQVGFEQSRTSLNYNALPASSVDGNLKASLKMDYRFKGGHGPFINLGTGAAPVHFAFGNAGDLLNGYEMAKNNLLFRMEAGYQYTSKAISFKKRAAVAKPVEAISTNLTQKKSCGSYQSRCGAKTKTATPVNKDFNMRLQPSLGLAYIPAAGGGTKEIPGGFEYDAFNWKTALVPAMGFELAKGSQRFLTLTVFYTKPLSQPQETFTRFSNGKPVTTIFQPNTSTWGMTLGVPMGFTKTKANTVSKTQKEKKACNRTYYRKCIKYN